MKMCECVLHVGQHVGVYLSFLIVPVKVNAKVTSSDPVPGNGVVADEDGHEVVNVLFDNLLYSKIIYAKSQGD